MTRRPPARPQPLRRLLASLPLREKIGQLTMVGADWYRDGPRLGPAARSAVMDGRAGSVLGLWGRDTVAEAQRLAREAQHGIGLLVGLDVLHGHRTIGPVPLAEAGAFDPDLWEETGRLAAAEAAADGVNLTFAPMLDVGRDPRWGRIVEGPGEDPWTACAFASAKVRGFQGPELGAPGSIAATAKHFAAYGAVRAGRDYASADPSNRELAEVYLPPFEAAVRSGVAAVMPAFIDVAGIPMTAHRALLRTVLRGTWRFEGVVVSDYKAIAELIAHGVAGDLAEAAALALRAGVDIDMLGEAYERGLPEALERGLVDIELVDEAVMRVLTLKQRLGLLGSAAPVLAPPPREQARAVALRSAFRSAILLQDRDALLPLKAPRSIAVLGPLADDGGALLGPWCAAARADEVASTARSLAGAFPGARIEVQSGVGGSDMRDAALDACRGADVTVLCLGETPDMSGEAASRVDPGLPDDQRQLAEAILATGRPVVVVLVCGRPLIVPWLFEAATTVLLAWFPGSMGGEAVAHILAGMEEPSGRLAVTWPRAVGQIPIQFGERPPGRPADPADRMTSCYLDSPVTPQFAFGHGLSQASVRVIAIRARPARFRPDETVEVEVDLRNDAARAGAVTLFVFVRDLVASVARPVLLLRGARSGRLAAGDQETLTFSLPASGFALLDENLEPRLEPGEFEIAAGLSAEGPFLRTRITLDEARS
jgi:beta-glucosidase